jgi:transcriptional regulator with XRE-family HTH domain
MPPITDTTSRLLAYRIRRLRGERGWTLSTLAEAIANNLDQGWAPTVSQLSSIETGKRPVSVPELYAIAEALSTTPDQLLRHGALCEACGQEMPK